MQNKPLPSVITKITQKQFEKNPALGKGVDFQGKFAIFKQLGCFGHNEKGKANGIKYVNESLYDVPSERFENILSGKSRFINEELKFFRQCLEYISNKECAARITLQQLLQDKVGVLLQNLYKHEIVLGWDGIDPVHALLGLIIPRHELYLKLQEPEEPKSRRIGLESTPILEETIDDDIILEPGYKFFLDIQEDSVDFKLQGKPVVIELGYYPNRDENGRSFRGQALSTVREIDFLADDGDGKTDEHYWQCSLKGNKPFYIQGEKGRFFFLVIGNAGENISPYLPVGADPLRITDDDLKFMYEKLALTATLSNDIVYGMLNYRV